MTRPVLSEGHPEVEQTGKDRYLPMERKKKKKAGEWPMGTQWGLAWPPNLTPSSPFADWETEAQEAEAGPHGPNFPEISTKI